MFAIKTESIKSYVETPKSLLKEHHNLIALIADNGNHFLAYGIVEGTTLYIDLDANVNVLIYLSNFIIFHHIFFSIYILFFCTHKI